MNNFEPLYDQIELYLKNKLSENDLIAFEKELSQNPALKEEVQIQKMSKEVMEHAYLAEMSSIVKDQMKTKKSSKWKLIFTFGTMTLGVFIFSMYHFNNSIDDELSENNVSIINIEDSLENKKDTVQKKTKKPKNNHKLVRHNTSETYLENNQGIVDQTTEDSTTLIQIISESDEMDADIEENDTASVAEKIEKREKTIPKPIQNNTLCVLPKMKDVKTVACNLNKDNGQIILDENVGLKYSINDGEFMTSPESDYYSVGHYEINAKDEKGCLYELGTVSINQSPCLKTKDFAFNIDFDQSLSISILETEKTDVSILNRAGANVLETSLNQESEFIWDGFYQDGEKAKIGIHKIIVRSNRKETCVYNVVISQ